MRLGAHLGLVLAGRRVRGRRRPRRAVVGVGGWLVHDGVVTVGTVAVFVLYLGNLFEPIQQLSQLFNTVQSAGAALAKLFGLLDTGRRARTAGRGRPAGARRRSRRGRRRSPTTAGVPVLTRRRPRDRTGRAARAGRPDRRRQVDAGQAGGAAATTPPRAASRSAASTSATRRSSRCASGSWSCPRRASSSGARSATTCASAGRTRPTPRSRRRCA